MITVVFEREKETLRTVRYHEVSRNGQPTRVGTLYLSKVTVADLGGPERVRVTIEDDDPIQLPVRSQP